MKPLLLCLLVLSPLIKCESEELQTTESPTSFTTEEPRQELSSDQTTNKVDTTVTLPDSLTTTESELTTTTQDYTTSTTQTTYSSVTSESGNVETTTETEETFGFFDFFGGTKTEKPEEKPVTVNIETLKQDRVDKISDQVRAILETYREHGVVTLPGASFPDPMSVPDIKKNFGGSPINFKDMKVYGLSNFTVDHINTDLDKMQVFVALNMKKIVILGNYSVRSWLTKAAGPFNVTLLDVETTGAAEVMKSENGSLHASNSEMDMTFMSTEVNFQNMGLMGAFLQGIISSVGPVLFDAVKPTILREVNTRVRLRVNDKLQAIGDKVNIEGKLSPIDQAIAEGRRYVLENGYDPYYIKDKTLIQPPIKVNITHFSLEGLSKFYRVGDVNLSMDNGTIIIELHLATKRLNGSCKWSFKFGTTFSKEGSSNFTVKHLQTKAILKQSLNVSHPPLLSKLDLNVGPIRLNMENKESFNFIVQLAVNSMPALIRHLIVDSLEIPLQLKVQEILNKVNVEEFIEKTLPELDNMGV